MENNSQIEVDFLPSYAQNERNLSEFNLPNMVRGMGSPPDFTGKNNHGPKTVVYTFEWLSTTFHSTTSFRHKGSSRTRRNSID